MKRLFFVVMAIGLISLAACAKKTELPVQEGNPAPDFTLQDLQGNPVSLAGLRGQVVMVNFWATWCPPCREEIPSLVRLNEAMSGKQFRMLAVSVDTGGKPDVEGLFKKLGVTLPALLDPTNQVANRYGITGVPETFIVDKKGTIVKKIIGPIDWSDPAVIRFLDDLIVKP